MTDFCGRYTTPLVIVQTQDDPSTKSLEVRLDDVSELGTHEGTGQGKSALHLPQAGLESFSQTDGGALVRTLNLGMDLVPAPQVIVILELVSSKPEVLDLADVDLVLVEGTVSVAANDACELPVQISYRKGDAASLLVEADIVLKENVFIKAAFDQFLWAQIVEPEDPLWQRKGRPKEFGVGHSDLFGFPSLEVRTNPLHRLVYAQPGDSHEAEELRKPSAPTAGEAVPLPRSCVEGEGGLGLPRDFSVDGTVAEVVVSRPWLESVHVLLGYFNR